MLLCCVSQATEVAPGSDRDHPPPSKAAEAADRRRTGLGFVYMRHLGLPHLIEAGTDAGTQTTHRARGEPPFNMSLHGYARSRTLTASSDPPVAWLSPADAMKRRGPIRLPAG